MGASSKEMRARLSPWQRWKTNAIHRMAVRLKKGATPIFNDVTKNRRLERERCRLLTFSLSKNVLNKINLPSDATGTSDHILRTQGKMETLVWGDFINH